MRPQGSSAGHNGMESIIGALGTQEFARVRLGIAPPHPVSSGSEFVLTPFRRSQEKTVVEVLDSALEAVKVILAEGIAAAMNRFNRRRQEEAAE